MNRPTSTASPRGAEASAGCGCRCMRSLVRWAVVAVVAVAAFVLVMESQKHRGYIFDPAVLREVQLEAVGDGTRPVEQVVADVVRLLADRYPGHIQTEAEWLFNNAGGAMGACLMLHTSLTEYVIVFGTAVGTEGHTGRYLADDFFYILHGEQWSFSEGRLTRDEFHVGDMHHLPAGEARQYRMPDACFALEYARGNIPAMLPFGIADTLTSTLDLRTLVRTFVLYARGVTHELLQGKF